MSLEKFGLLLSDDLMFTSRITGTAQDLGLSMTVVRSQQELLQAAQSHRPSCVIVDLNNPGLDVQSLNTDLRTDGTSPTIIAYGSHVETAMLKAAREAGCDLVLPRSKFVEELPTKLGEWLRTPNHP